MKEYQVEPAEVKILSRIFCNCCGKEIDRSGKHAYRDYVSIHKDWGYDSPFDGEVHDIDLCADCYEAWIRNFRIDPRQGGDDEDV